MAASAQSVDVVKTSALALVPEEKASALVQSIRFSYDRQVHLWPPHVNLFYPFVLERDFPETAERLAEALQGFTGSLKLRFSNLMSFGKTQALGPDQESEKQLRSLLEVIREAMPDVPMEHSSFRPHLTFGQFEGSQSEAYKDMFKDLELSGTFELCFLARDTMNTPFRTVSRVQISSETASSCVVPGDGKPYVFRPSKEVPKIGKTKAMPATEVPPKEAFALAEGAGDGDEQNGEQPVRRKKERRWARPSRIEQKEQKGTGVPQQNKFGALGSGSSDEG